jgi:hypothetical protein
MHNLEARYQDRLTEHKINDINQLKNHLKDFFKDKTKTSTEVVLEVYKFFIPEFDQIKSINGWPTISPELSDFLFDQFVNMPKQPGVLNGGAWMNAGFSRGDKLSGFNVDFSKCNIEWVI